MMSIINVSIFINILACDIGRKQIKWRVALGVLEIGFRTGTAPKPGLKLKNVGFFDFSGQMWSCDPSFDSKFHFEHEYDLENSLERTYWDVLTCLWSLWVGFFLKIM